MKEVNQTRSNSSSFEGEVDSESKGKTAKPPMFGLIANTPPPPLSGTLSAEGDALTSISQGGSEVLLGMQQAQQISNASVGAGAMAAPPAAPLVAPTAQPVAPAPAPAPPVITYRTTLDAADSSGHVRRRVGVGEQVTFTSTVAGNWTASSGDPAVSAAAGTTFVWRAPNRAATPRITVTTATGATANVDMDVIEPSSMTPVKRNDINYAAGVAGAGMNLFFDYNPMTVSFANVEAGEVSGPATNVTGYFTAWTAAQLHHNSGDGFFGINGSNRLNGVDTAAGSGFGKPWSAGGFDWVIPNRFRVAGEAGAGKVFDNITQTFRLAANGSVTVGKGAESYTRVP